MVVCLKLVRVGLAGAEYWRVRQHLRERGQGYNAANTYTFDDGLTWIKGEHTFKGGFQYVKMQQNTGGFGRQSGYLNFNCGTDLLAGPLVC